MSLLNAFDHFLVGFRSRRNRIRTERAIRSLPLDVRKDIGWPDGEERERERIRRIASSQWRG